MRLCVRIQWGNHSLPDSPTAKRVDFINDLKNRLPKYTITGGDWNVVPDVTVDRRGPNALQNANVGAAALADAVDALKIYDIRAFPVRAILGLGAALVVKNSPHPTR